MAQLLCATIFLLSTFVCAPAAQKPEPQESPSVGLESSKFSRFLPKNAVTSKQMTIIFADERKPSTVLAYAAKTADYDYEIGIQVLQCNRSKWASTYKEENLVSTGGAPLDVRTVRSASGSEGGCNFDFFGGGHDDGLARHSQA